MSTTDWLLDSDPALRWQVLRDLVTASPDEVGHERARVATEGWGAALLAARDTDGQWAGGAHFPADHRWGQGTPQPWTATSHALTQLREFGVDPADPGVVETIGLIRANCRWEHAGQPYFDGEVEPCINGQLVANGCYFGQDMTHVVERLLGDQLDDGGWNCWTENGATVSSAASTIDVLEGLFAYELAIGGSRPVAAARRRGEQYLLERRLFRRKSTGDVVDDAWLLFVYPPRWHYDVLRALVYFAWVGEPPDPRLAEAIALLRDRRGDDGMWPLDHAWPGAVHFAMETVGEPSRWNTLRALRVLAWHDGDAVTQERATR